MNLNDQQFALICGVWALALLGGVGAVGCIEANGSVALLSVVVGISGVAGAIFLGVLAVALVTIEHSDVTRQIPGAIAVATGGFIAIGGIIALQPWARTGLAGGVASIFAAIVGGSGALLVIVGGVSIQSRRVKLPLYACAIMWCGGWIYTAQLSTIIMTRYSVPLATIILVVTGGPLIGISTWSPPHETGPSPAQ